MSILGIKTLISRSSAFTESRCSLTPVFAACRTIRDLEQVHTQIIHNGVEQDHILITHFINLCITLSSKISYASSIFDRVSQPNIYLWNSLINGHCKHSSLANSFRVFRRMKWCTNVFPDEYTFPPLVKSCSKGLASREGHAIHGSIVRHGSGHCVFVGSSLVDMYGKWGEIRSARKVFDEMCVRNEVSWTSMIVGYVNVGDVMEAKKLFDEMPSKNAPSWNAMIAGFVRFGDMANARELFGQMPERNVVSFTTMIDGYAKEGDMASARFLFDQSPDRDIVSWSALISGYVQNNQPNEAVNIFLEMQATEVKPDEFILVSLMSACSLIGSLDLARWLDSYVSESSLDIHRDHIRAALIDMNAKCGNLERAMVLFEETTKRDLITYCSMIQGFSIHGRGAQAVAFFDRMLSEGLTPDGVAFTVLLTACSRAGLLEEGCRYFGSMINDYSLVPSADHYACMVDLLGRCGKVREAYKLLKSMPLESHIGAWGALLGACKLHCDAELGEEIAAKLFELDPQNSGNYVLLSDIYAAGDRWLDVYHLRNKMIERGVKKKPGCSASP